MEQCVLQLTCGGGKKQRAYKCTKQRTLRAAQNQIEILHCSIACLMTLGKSWILSESQLLEVNKIGNFLIMGVP